MGRLDPVTLSVLASALAGIAEEMGAVLIRGSYSSNIKERRDCSTALFDSEGRMVAQAEHIPVHLGAMPESVAAVMERDPQPGDVVALNDPYSGGTHLPHIMEHVSLELQSLAGTDVSFGRVVESGDFEELPGHRFQHVAPAGEDVPRGPVGVGHDALDLGVDELAAVLHDQGLLLLVGERIGHSLAGLYSRIYANLVNTWQTLLIQTK